MIEPRKLFGGIGNRMFQMAYIYSQLRKGEIPDIYIQDFRRWEPYKDEIRKWYQQGIGEPKNFVALHIRRGDYVENPFYVDLTKTEYYDKAIKMFPGEKFLVFYQDRQGTNDYVDRQWVTDYLTKKGVKFEVWNGRDEVEDLNAMASCKSIIMANSSFSFWAAFLSPYAEKVICPLEWHPDKVVRTQIPEDRGWIRF